MCVGRQPATFKMATDEFGSRLDMTVNDENLADDDVDLISGVHLLVGQF